MRGAARLATYLGRVMVAVGLVIMFIGWNSAAGLDFAQGQLPYVLSASVPGLALVVVGMSLEFVQTVRELTARRSREAAQVDAAMSRLLGFVRDGGDVGTAVLSPEDEATIPPGAQAFAPLTAAQAPVSAPVSAPPATQAAPEPTATPEPAPEPVQDARRVVAGRSSFHDPSCRLVSNREDMQTIDRREASDAGLAPCRICKP